MGLKDWIERRRQKKLDEINREIESLRQQGLLHHKVHEVKGGKGMNYLRKDSSVVLVAVIVIAIISLAGVSLLYHGSYKDLKELHAEVSQKLVDAEAKLASREELLNKTSSELSFKKAAEKDLSKQYTDLESEKTKLEEEISDLKIELANLQQELENVKEELDEANDQISFYKVCITDELSASLSDCS